MYIYKVSDKPPATLRDDIQKKEEKNVIRNYDFLNIKTVIIRKRLISGPYVTFFFLFSSRITSRNVTRFFGHPVYVCVYICICIC